MVSIILDHLQIVSLNKTRNLEIASSHFSNPRLIFDFESNLYSLLHSDYYEWVPLINEYLAQTVYSIFFGIILYFLVCGIDYLILFIWKKETTMPNFDGKYYIARDIGVSIINLLCEAFLTSIVFMLIPRYSYIYYDVNDYGYGYLIASILVHMCIDEFLVYYIHRILHIPWLYEWIHSVHHFSNDVTPFASLAFHPLDAFFIALPTMCTCFLFPVHFTFILVYLYLSFMLTISVHDNTALIPFKLFLYSTHHTVHHEVGMGKFRNYGKAFSVMDRLMGTYEDPDRLDYGWKRNDLIFRICQWLNYYVEKFIPDRTKKPKKLKEKVQNKNE